MTKLTKLSRSIEGRVVLITGAGSGMGRATAHVFAEAGAKVVVTDLNEENVNQEVVGSIPTGSTKIQTHNITFLIKSLNLTPISSN